MEDPPGGRAQRPGRRRHGALRGRAGETREVAALVERYGDAIEADLQTHYRLELHPWFGPAPRPSPRRLKVLLDHLPRASHLRSAISRDVELYERSGAAERPPLKPPAPDLAEFPPDVELLAAIYDRLGEAIRALAALGGSKRRVQLKPWGRPESAAELWLKHRRRQNYLHLEAAVVFVDPAEVPAGETTLPVRVRR